MKRPIFYDTETTGIRPERDHIIEIAAYDPVQDRTFEALINPGCPIPPEATAIHKITDEMVADKPSFKEIGAQFAAFCEGNTVLIAHNNDSFDLPFLKSSFKRHELHFPTWE
ncbi:MAG: ribonuclease H-like domain-containing protein, partial [Chlamydiia bacterium]|nr:ribonuclease H-like domain-containing protein [Chlamydiia bacterium]